MQAIRVAERFADGRATKSELYKARQAANYFARPELERSHLPYDSLISVASCAAATDSVFAAVYADAHVDGDRHIAANRDYRGRLLVSVIGPGWEFAPRWRTDTTVAIAKGMYKSRDFSAMPILADALEDEGVNERVLLDALRSPDSAWCRGSRILDELLGKREQGA